jgi:HSP20 family protein
MKILRRKGERGALAPRSREGSGPINDLNRIRQEINRIFEDPLALLARGTSFFEGWEPSLDVYEDPDKITVRAELPGMEKENINVSLEGNTLTIAGERKHEEERKEGNTFRSERFFGRFQRSVTLPQPVDVNRLQANYKDGVLSIVCPKSEEAKPKQIQISA